MPPLWAAIPARSIPIQTRLLLTTHDLRPSRQTRRHSAKRLSMLRAETCNARGTHDTPRPLCLCDRKPASPLTSCPLRTRTRRLLPAATGRRQLSSLSSIGDEMGVLGLVPARTMRATAAECLLPVTSQAIRKHRRDRGVCAGVAPDFMTKRNSALVDIRDRVPTTPSVPSLANCGS